jgi:hypothetical protein
MLSPEELQMQTVYEEKTIYITDVDVIEEEDGYYTVVYYSDGEHDEFGPYDSYREAKSAIY